MSLPAHRVAPARFGGYILTELIGEGGMAVVYKAKREGWSGFEKTVVVKAMQPALTINQQFVELFIAEAKITAQLSHPGIVQVHDFGVYQGTPYLVMDYLNGINLAQLMRTLSEAAKAPPVPVTLVIVTEMCHALGYAHHYRAPDGSRRQIIHSDVSPSNVMVCRDGSVKLLDFGVAKIVDERDYDVSVTVKGKYPYMSPEQVNRLPIDRRADVFAAGIVLWELLTGRRLFAAATDLDTLKNVDAAEVEAPSKRNPDVPPELDAIVLRALARDPGERFDSGLEMALALQKVGPLGGGRRRVAEYLAGLFPMSSTPAALEPTVQVIDPTPPVTPPSLLPPPEPVPPPAPVVIPPPAPQRVSAAMIASVAITLVVVAIAAGLGGLMIGARFSRVTQHAPPVRARFRPPAAHPSVIFAAPVEIPDPPLPPVLPPARSHKRARQKPIVIVAPPVEPAPPPASPPPLRVKDGRLLEPFGGP